MCLFCLSSLKNHFQVLRDNRNFLYYDKTLCNQLLLITKTYVVFLRPTFNENIFIKQNFVHAVFYLDCISPSYIYSYHNYITGAWRKYPLVFFYNNKDAFKRLLQGLSLPPRNNYFNTLKYIIKYFMQI